MSQHSLKSEQSFNKEAGRWVSGQEGSGGITASSPPAHTSTGRSHISIGRSHSWATQSRSRIATPSSTPAAPAVGTCAPLSMQAGGSKSIMTSFMRALSWSTTTDMHQDPVANSPRPFPQVGPATPAVRATPEVGAGMEAGGGGVLMRLIGCGSSTNPHSCRGPACDKACEAAKGARDLSRSTCSPTSTLTQESLRTSRMAGVTSVLKTLPSQTSSRPGSDRMRSRCHGSMSRSLSDGASEVPERSRQP